MPTRPRLILALLIVVLLALNLLALTASVYWMSQSRQQYIDRAENHTRNIANALQQSLSSSIGKIDFALQHLTDQLELQLAKDKVVNKLVINATFTRIQDRIPEIEGLRVADEQGRVFLGNGVNPAKPVDITDRDYFLTFRDGHEHALFISKPLWGRLVNHHIINFSRRFNHSDGRFAGVVFATIPLDYFQKLLDRFDLGPQGTVILRDLELGLIVRSPPLPNVPAGQVGNQAVSKEFRAVFETGTVEASFHTPVASDRHERIFAFRRFSNAPMLINVGVSGDEYLGGWRSERNKILVGNGSFVLVTLALGLLLWRLLNSLTLEALRNRIYLRNASDGIQITDVTGHLIEANDRLSTMLGYSRFELLAMDAQTWLACWPEAQARDAILKQTIPVTAPLFIETTLRRKNGATLDVEVSLSHFYWSKRLHVYASVRDITERRASAEKIELLAFYDPLTLLPNRRLMMERLKHALLNCVRRQSRCALLMIDIDHFKLLNDTLGHDVGDQLLLAVARRLQASVRQGDTAARMGGDEFVVILEDLDESSLGSRQAEVVAEKIRQILCQPFDLNMGFKSQGDLTREYQCSASIGLCLFNDNSLSIDELLKRADTAMYQAKAAGRDSVRFFDPQMQVALETRAAMEADLQQAVAQNHLQLYFQPQVNSAGLIFSTEVLLRWQHPKRGLVMPGDFIPLAEESGQILQIGAWVLETACAQLTRWSAHEEFRNLQISVNVSARQFRQPNFVSQVTEIVAASGADPKLLKLELTESMILNSVQETVFKMKALHALGISFSLDDFGTGYSSLSYLQRLPLDELKIDQSFVHDLLVNDKSSAIAQTVINLAQNLGLGVMAEGVESAAQRDHLIGLGCQSFQGYFFGRPVVLAEFELLVRIRYAIT